MKIKVLQKDFIFNVRYAKQCDHIFTCTVWNGKSKVVYKNQNIISNIINDTKKVITIYSRNERMCLIFLFNQLKNLDKKFILVSGCSDNTITKELYNLKPKNFIAWFSENIDYCSDDLFALPMGSEAGTWIGGKEFGEHTDHPKFKLIKLDNKDPQIINLAFMCFSIETHTSHRKQVYDYFNNKPWVTNLCKQKTNKYLDDDKFMENIYNHKFVICPFGNGIDCGRTWIVLQLGSIPILPYHICFKEWANNLPIILYHNLTDITEEYLLNKLKEFENKNYNYDYLKNSYWKNKFKENR